MQHQSWYYHRHWWLHIGSTLIRDLLLSTGLSSGHSLVIFFASSIVLVIVLCLSSGANSRITTSSKRLWYYFKLPRYSEDPVLGSTAN